MQNLKLSLYFKSFAYDDKVKQQFLTKIWEK